MILMLTAGLMALFLVGMPIAIALGLSSMAALLVGDGSFNSAVLSMKMQFGLQNFLLVAVPLFILAAKLMNTGGITDRIFRFSDVLVGFLPGGLGQANVLASLLFAGMSGSAVVDAAGLGTTELSAMKKGGYPKPFSVAITAASSTIGPVFPPSVPMIVFSFASGASVGRLFLGGVVPGLLMSVALMIMVASMAKRLGLPRSPVPTVPVVVRSFLDAFFPLLTPVILLSGIWGGYVTPTEAAALAVIYALFVGTLLLKELGAWEIKRALVETARETAVICLIVAAASLYGWVMMRSGLTAALSGLIKDITTDPTLMMLLIVALLLVVGCFLDGVVAILILTPVLLPVTQAVGIDQIHFGVVMVVTLMIGLITPPFGLVLFVMARISHSTFNQVVKAVWPFLIPLVITLLLITLFPSLVTWLPNQVMGP